MWKTIGWSGELISGKEKFNDEFGKSPNKCLFNVIVSSWICWHSLSQYEGKFKTTNNSKR